MPRPSQPARESLPLPLDAAFADLSAIEYLAILDPTRARRGLESLFARGRVRSGGRPVSSNARIGDLGALELGGGWEGVETIHLAGGDAGCAILHEDEALIALSKPSGVPVIPDRTRGQESCLGQLVAREIASRAGKPLAACLRPRVVHRIDRATSGLVLVAKTPRAERELGDLFARSRVKKTYWALLEGEVLPARTAVHCPIGEGRKGRMRIAIDGKDAVTEIDVLERLRGATIVLARPRTGRTHQIRVHAAAIGHAVAGDPLYGRRAESAGVEGAPPARLALHSWRYELPASWEGRRVFECPLAQDLVDALERWRRETAGGGS